MICEKDTEWGMNMMARMGKEGNLAHSDWARQDQGRRSEGRRDHSPEKARHCKLVPKLPQMLPAALFHLMAPPSL